jgi:hypothetical protein
MSPVLSQSFLFDQPALPGFCQITDAVQGLAHASSVDERGAIFTRREVVDFILDLVGYVVSEPLCERSWRPARRLSQKVKRLRVLRVVCAPSSCTGKPLTGCAKKF